MSNYTPIGNMSSEYLEQLRNDLSKNASKRKTELGKDEFLQLLMVQLSSQDPLSPMSDTDFIAQMAQFSSLEQMNQMNNTMTMNNAYSLIGKNISYVHPTSGKEILGKVSTVFSVNGSPRLQVGDHVITLSDVISIYDEKLFNLESAYNMVGKNVTFSETVTTSVPKLDEEGNAVKDEDGNDVMEEKETTTEYSGKVISAFNKDGLPFLKVEIVGEDGKATTKEISVHDVTGVTLEQTQSDAEKLLEKIANSLHEQGEYLKGLGEDDEKN